MFAQRYLCVGLVAVCVASACASDKGSSSSAGPQPAGVGQGGAADFGRFRALLDSGEIPAPDTIDAVGFLNEHKLEMPAPNCGQDLCIHGLVGASGDLVSGTKCAMLMVGMNTPIDPAHVPRPPLALALAVDTSGSMAGEKIERVKTGLLQMLAALHPADRVTLVHFAASATLLVANATPSSGALKDAIDGLVADGATDIYGGLRAAFEALQEAPTGSVRRVLLVSDGEATSGLTSRDRIVALAHDYAALGIGLSTIGLGRDFDIELMRTLAEQGAGSFYFVENASAVPAVFGKEAALTLVPLASTVAIEVAIGAGYELRAVFGATPVSRTLHAVRFEMPILQLASRTTVDDVSQGRRGGGGAILLALLPTGTPTASLGTLDLSYRAASNGRQLAQHIAVGSPPSALPVHGFFSDPSVEKAFLAANILAGFTRAAEHAAVGEYGTTLGILAPLDKAVQRWLASHADADIEDDYGYITRFQELAQQQDLLARPQAPPDLWVQY